MMYPPSFLDRLRTHFRLSEIVGTRVALKKQGRELGGLCPFHSEKSPSFTVSDEKGFYHCFGCSAHGDVFDFLQKTQGFSFHEAVEHLAHEAGIPVPERSEESIRQEEGRTSLLDVMEAACRWFEVQLAAPAHMAARAYAEQRGLHADTQRRFRLGYAPEAREGLKKHLLTQGITEQHMVEAGLLIQPDHGASYDRFRGRLMFPIRDPRGRVIAFGGRLMAAADPARPAPKYLNSPETPLFKKGEVLFNLDQAASPARERGEIVIVEGYMDAIAMAQASFPYVVATLGTAVTAEHLKTLWRAVPEPLLCLDGDAAGARAMLRAAELALPLLTPGMSLRFCLLPTGEDPDSLLKHRGAAALASALKEARSLSDTLWRHFSSFASASAEGRAALEHTLMELCKRIEHPTVQHHYRQFFKDQLWTLNRGKKPLLAPTRSAAVQRMAATPTSDAHLSTVRRLLWLVLAHPALLHEQGMEETLARIECTNPALNHLREAMLQAAAEHDVHDDAGFHAALEAAGCTQVVRALKDDRSLTLPDSSLVAGRKAWARALEAEHLHVLEAEYQQAEERAATSMGEGELQQLLALQEKIRALRARALADATEEHA